MRKIILLLNLIFIACVSFSNDYAEVKEYTRTRGENQVPLFRHFLAYDTFSGLKCIYLKDNNIIECYDSEFGNWQIKGDTLYVYQFWEDIPILDSITKAKNELPFQKTFECLNGRRWSDKSYPINVSAFLILEDGGFLRGIKDPWETKAFATSSAKRGDVFLYFTSPDDSLRYTKERGVKVYKNYYDSIIWKPIYFGKRCGNFKILRLTKKDRHCATIDAEMENMTFRIFNPLFYRGPGEITQRDRSFTRLSCWMDSIEVGDNVFLCLSRPLFADSICRSVRYLRNFPDSIYVMDNEVYGCWFASKIE